MASERSKQIVIGLSKTQTPANFSSILIILYVGYQNLSLSQWPQKYTYLQFKEQAKKAFSGQLIMFVPLCFFFFLYYLSTVHHLYSLSSRFCLSQRFSCEQTPLQTVVLCRWKQGNKFLIDNQWLPCKQNKISAPTYQKSLIYLFVKYVQSYLYIVGVVFRRIVCLLKQEGWILLLVYSGRDKND